MKVIETALPGVLIVELQAFGDARGFLQETFQAQRYGDAGLPATFVQDNHSRSVRGVLRGMHLQTSRPQGKLVTVLRGSIFDVAVDVDPGSPNFGAHVAVELSDANHRQLYIPPGYAHGFAVLSEVADVVYKCTEFYDPAGEGGLIWNDPQVAIPWPLRDPLVSAKDTRLPSLADLRRARS